MSMRTETEEKKFVEGTSFETLPKQVDTRDNSGLLLPKMTIDIR